MIPVYEFGLNQKTVLKILENVHHVMTDLSNNFLKPYKLTFSNKNLSEIISKVIESKAAQILTQELGYDVVSASSDSDPDIFFTATKTPLEVKVTSTDSGWTGGEFSKRPFNYLLVSWNPKSDFSEFFVAYTHLDEKDWESRMKTGAHYYGPLFSAKRLLGKDEYIVFIGALQTTKRGSVRIEHHNIFQKKLG
jgi:hypothetical protein